MTFWDYVGAVLAVAISAGVCWLILEAIISELRP